jgi:hypothetical protein
MFEGYVPRRPDKAFVNHLFLVAIEGELGLLGP